MKRLFFFLIQVLILIPALSFAGTAYYVNPQAPAGGNGTYVKPWNSIAQINAHKFSKGDDVYFKVGTTTPLAAGQRLNINWDGSKNDPAIIGAYYGENKFGLNGGGRPIINGLVGGVRTGGVLSSGAINYIKPDAIGYVHVKDLHITGVIGYGVSLHGKNGIAGEGQSIEHCTVENVKTSNTASIGIGLYHSFYGLILNCIVEDANQRIRSQDPTSPYVTGDSIDIGGLQQEGRSKYNTVRGCTVARGYEGIGVYQGALYTTIENNTIYDCRTYHIYVDNSRYGVIRNNIIYSTLKSRAIPVDGSRGSGIVHDGEGHNPNVGLRVVGNWEIYGNKIAGMSSGIVLLCNSYVNGVYQTNNKIYNNTLVDCQFNLRFNHDQYGGWKNNLIYDNYSFTFSKAAVHTNKTSPLGVTWNNNFFNSALMVKAGASLMNGQFNLVKATGWQSLPPGGVNESFFQFANENLLAPPKIIDISRR